MIVHLASFTKSAEVPEEREDLPADFVDRTSSTGSKEDSPDEGTGGPPAATTFPKTGLFSKNQREGTTDSSGHPSSETVATSPRTGCAEDLENPSAFEKDREAKEGGGRRLVQHPSRQPKLSRLPCGSGSALR